MRELSRAIGSLWVELAFKNRDSIMESPQNQCICYRCCTKFIASDIKEWVDGGETALCPNCGIDSVAVAQHDTVTDEMLKGARIAAFGEPNMKLSTFQRLKNALLVKLYTMQDKLDDTFVRPVVRFKNNLQRALEYAKYGWGSYDWDYVYLIDEIAWKLRRIGKYIKEENLIESADTVYKETHEAANLLTSPTNEEDLEKQHDELYLKHPQIDDTFLGKHENHEEFIQGLLKLDSEERRQYDESIAKALDIIKEKHKGWWS